MEAHYADLAKKGFFAGLVEYMSSGPVCAMVWEGDNAVATGRKMLGATKPSDSVESAEAEIKLWFKDEEVCQWSHHGNPWVY